MAVASKGVLFEYGLSLPPLALVFDFNPQQISRSRTVTIKTGNAPGAASRLRLPHAARNAARGAGRRDAGGELLDRHPARRHRQDATRATRSPRSSACSRRSTRCARCWSRRCRGRAGLKVLSSLGRRRRARLRAPGDAPRCWSSPGACSSCRSSSPGSARRRRCICRTSHPYRAEMSLTMQVIEIRQPVLPGRKGPADRDDGAQRRHRLLSEARDGLLQGLLLRERAALRARRRRARSVFARRAARGRSARPEPVLEHSVAIEGAARSASPSTTTPKPRDWRRIAEANPDACSPRTCSSSPCRSPSNGSERIGSVDRSSRGARRGAMISLGALLDPGFRQPASCLIEVGEDLHRHRHHSLTSSTQVEITTARARGGDGHHHHRGPAQRGRPVDGRRLRPVHALGADQGFGRLPDACARRSSAATSCSAKPSYPNNGGETKLELSRPGRERRARPRAHARPSGATRRRSSDKDILAALIAPLGLAVDPESGTGQSSPRAVAGRHADRLPARARQRQRLRADFRRRARSISGRCGWTARRRRRSWSMPGARPTVSASRSSMTASGPTRCASTMRRATEGAEPVTETVAPDVPALGTTPVADEGAGARHAVGLARHEGRRRDRGGDCAPAPRRWSTRHSFRIRANGEIDGSLYGHVLKVGPHRHRRRRRRALWRHSITPTRSVHRFIARRLPPAVRADPQRDRRRRRRRSARSSAAASAIAGVF